jgi:phage gpG-like protein
MERITLLELERRLRLAADPGRTQRIVTESLVDARPVAVAGVRQCFIEKRSPAGIPWPALKHPRPGESTPGDPLRDRGHLMAAVAARSSGLSVTVFANRPGARLHQFGGRIVPRNVEFLSIPATVEAKEAGSPRAFKGELRPIINAQRTKGVLVGPWTPGVPWEELPVQYYLTKEVTIPARPYMGFSAGTVATILHLVARRWWRSLWRSD